MALANVEVTVTEPNVTVSSDLVNVSVATNTTNLIVGNALVTSTSDIRNALGNTLPITYDNVTGIFGFDANLDDLTLKKYQETIVSGGSASGAVSVNIANGTVHTLTLNGNVTGITLNNISAGGSASLIFTQDGAGGRFIDTTTTPSNWATWRFANSSSDLDTNPGAWNIMNVFYDGTNYYASITEKNALQVPNSSLANSSLTVNGRVISLGSSGNIVHFGPLTTDDLTQGSTNQYYSDALSRAALSMGTPALPSGNGSLIYNNVNGVFTFTPPDKIGYTDLSVVTAGPSGNGSLSYDSAGVFTFTPPDLSASGLTNAQAQAFIQSSGLTMTADITSSNLIKTTGNLQVNADVDVSGLSGLTFDSATNNLGLGTPTPKAAIHIRGTSNESQIYMTEFNSGSGAGIDLRTYAAAGSESVPEPKGDNKRIWERFHYAYDSSGSSDDGIDDGGFSVAFAEQILSDGSHSAGSVPVYYQLYHYRDGDTSNNPTSFLKARANGDIEFGTPIGSAFDQDALPATVIDKDGIYTSNANITTTANISGNYILGNGSQLTGITTSATNSFGTALVSGQTNIQATQANAQIEFVAGTGVTLTTSGNALTINSTGGGGGGITNAQAQSFIQSSGLTMTADITSSNLIKTTGNLQVNPDTTVGGLKGLTFDSATNRLGLGTTTPETAIHIVSDGDIDSQIYMDEYSTSSSANDIRMRRAEGTLAAPRFMNSGDHIGQWYHYPWRENADPTANAAFSDLYGGSFASTGGVEISSFTDGDYIVNDITVDTIENQAGAGDGDLLKFTDRSIRFNDGTMFVLTGTTNSGLASLNGQAFYVDQGGGSTSSTYELYYDEARTNPVKVASGVQTATDMIAKVVSTAQPVGLEIIINENKVDRYSERRITKWRANGTMEFGATSTDDGTGAAASITPQGVFTTSGNITSTANVSGLNILGNGSNLTGIDLFKTISVSGQSDVVADTISDTLTLAAGSGMTITTDAGTDTITFASSGGGGGSYGNAEVQTYLASGNNAGNISTKGNVIVAKHTGTVVSTIGSYFGSGNTGSNDQIQPSTDPQWSDATAIVMSGTTNSNLTFLNGNTYYTKSVGGGAYEIHTNSGLSSPVQSGLGSESPTGLVASYPGEVNSRLDVAGDIYTTGDLEVSSANVLTTITEYQGNATTGTGDKIFIGSDQGWYNGQYVTFQGATDASLTFLNGNTYQVATGSGSGTTWNLYSNYQNFTKLETAVGTVNNPSGPLKADHRTPNNTTATIYGDLIVNANSVLKVNAIESFFPNQVINLTGLRVNDFKGNDPINPPSYTNTQLATLQQPFPGGYIFVTGDRAVDGEGVPAYWSGTQWKYFSDNANVSYT